MNLKKLHLKSIKNWRKKWGKYHCPCCKSLLCADNWGPSLTILDISNELEDQIDEKITQNGTDAEGRVILADTLAYSIKFNPSIIIDFATL